MSCAIQLNSLMICSSGLHYLDPMHVAIVYNDIIPVNIAIGSVLLHAHAFCPHSYTAHHALMHSS